MVSFPASIFERSRISLISPSRSCPPRCTQPSEASCSALSGPSTPASSASVNPRIAVIGVRSSWLTLARNRDFASLAPLEGGVGLAEPCRQRPLIVEQRRQPLAGAVEVSRQRAELVTVRDLDALVEVPRGDVRQTALHLADGQDERPREDEPEHQRHDHARRGEGDHHAGEEVGGRLEVALRRGHVLLGAGDERPHRRLELVRGRVLLAEVEGRGLRDLALVEQRQDLLTGLPVLLVDLPDAFVERGVGRLGLLHARRAAGRRWPWRPRPGRCTWRRPSG